MAPGVKEVTAINLPFMGTFSGWLLSVGGEIV
jgi:hypothetical protein